MKIVCAPLDLGFKGHGSADLQVVLYGQPDNKTRGGIGGNIREKIAHFKLRPAPRAWDLLSIALSVVASDTASLRTGNSDGWTRELDLQTAVGDDAFWTLQRALVENALRFLTTDIWRVSFLGQGIQPAPPKHPVLPEEDCAALLSGGLDSLIGVLDLAARQKKRPYLVSQVSQGDKQTQSYFAANIGGGLSHLQLNHVVTVPGVRELSQRSRSVIFLAYGVLAATTLKTYQDGNTVPLYVCENGFISVNPPLTPARVGSLSTRTTHPVFLALFQQILDAAGLRVRIENPYQFMTKGEMLNQCADQTFLNKHAHSTTSCGRYARNAYRHCGRCVPCLIRRAAFHAWKQADKTEYVFADLGKDDAKHAGFDDVRSAGMAVASVKSDGFDRWFGSSLSSVLIPDATSYKQTVARGLKEIEQFLMSAGVK